MEEVLKITDNGVALEKLYLFLTIHLLPVNYIAQLKCNIEFISNIQLIQRNKSVAPSNEALIKSGISQALWSHFVP